MAIPTVRDVLKASRREFASVEEEKSWQEAAKELNKDAEANWHRPEWQHEQALQIAETLDWGFVNESVFPSYFPFRAARRNEPVVLRERRGLKVFYTHRAGEIDESQLTSRIWEIPADSLGWHVREFEDNVQVGYAEFISDLLPLARSLEEATVNQRIFSTLQAAVGPASDYYISGAFGESVLRDAITDVEDTPIPSNGTLLNRGVTVVGRKRAIQQILDFPSFNDNTADAIARTGVLGTYYGANIVTLKNYQDEDGVSFIPEDELWVLGGQVGMAVAYGGPKVKTWTENKVDYRHFQSRRDFGIAVTHPEVSRRIVLDSASS